MKKFLSENEYFTISKYILFVIITAIIFEKIIGNIGLIADTAGTVFNFIIGILTPFIYGIFIAYILNSPVKWFENNVYLKIPFGRKKVNYIRTISILTTYLLVIGFLVCVIRYIFPEIRDNLDNLILSLRTYAAGINMEASAYSNTNEFLNSMLVYFNETFTTSYTPGDIINFVIDPIMKTLSSLPFFLNVLLAGTVNFAYALLNAVLGLVIAFYMLCEKEKFAATIGKFLYTILKKQTAERVILTAKSSNAVFEKFFIGKAIDSIIIGILFFIIALIINLPFTLLSSLIIGITNMIPYFGPFIGAIPVILITLLVNPVLALWLTLIIFLLQQFDGLILGPKILGESTGMKPIGVIFSIIVGGALFGVIGMFFGVPAFAVLKVMFTTLLNKKYNEKYVTIEAYKTT